MTLNLAAWLQALRLKFYPMSWIAFALGALLAAGTRSFTTGAFWTGLSFLFFLEVATVLSNDYFDFATDSANDRAGPFNGGSRVLVDNRLTMRQVAAGIWISLGLAVAAALAVLLTTRGAVVASGALIFVLALFAVGYTVPPLKLSYRTLGELDVCITDSIGVLLCGYVFLGGDWHDPDPWWLSLPLGLAFLPSITLCAVPDFEADRRAGKRTIAVRFGIPTAVRVAQASALMAASSAIWLDTMVLPDSFGPLVWLSLAHALALVWLLRNALRAPGGLYRIDGLMVVALTFVVWFGTLPLIVLLRGGAI